MKKKVLVIYYTQTGQLSKALKATLAPLADDESVELYYENIQPITPYPYPWTYTQFFDVFPETVQGKAAPLIPFTFDINSRYDLVVLAYQPWFLSICVPINSFLQSNEAQKILHETPVITLIACRNMWLSGQEKMKAILLKLNAKLVGNITFVDRSANLISLVTVLAFVLGGIKENFLGIFPKYGVSDKDLVELAPKYGEIILKNLKSENYNEQQSELNTLGATVIKSNLLIMEGRGRALFPLYANYISKKGTAKSDERKLRVRIFGIVLPTAILILSPIITIISRLAPILFPAKIRKEISYYEQNKLR